MPNMQTGTQLKVVLFELAGYGPLGEQIKEHKLMGPLIKGLQAKWEEKNKAAGSGDELQQLLLSVAGLEESERAGYLQGLAAARVTVEQLSSMTTEQLLMVQQDSKIPSGILMRIIEAAKAAAAQAAAEAATEAAAEAAAAGTEGDN
jgi:hypothetical protein